VFVIHEQLLPLQESATLPSATADGKGKDGGRKKAPAKYGSIKSFFVVCFLKQTAKGPLLSAADGKESRWQ